jgi:plastocyanin
MVYNVLPKDFYISYHKNNNMKQYILLLALLMILITSCAPIIDVEEAQPVETPEEVIEEVTPEEPEEVILEESEETILENTIEINPDAFSPEEKTISKNTEIKWVKKDTRDYKIGCYLEGTRVIQSPNLKEGDSFTYTFLQEGKYTCITTPYGLRNIITVEANAPLLSPTGTVILNQESLAKGAPLAAVAMIAIIALLFFIYGRKRK